jgi:hypothetical protein
MNSARATQMEMLIVYLTHWFICVLLEVLCLRVLPIVLNKITAIQKRLFILIDCVFVYMTMVGGNYFILFFFFFFTVLLVLRLFGRLLL